ncbi:hypothetical protein RRG08_059246 [Elysia crispata]|uniref:Uncharacterized protein n=1 Tax=Elysia crispata TaxID=231223 RepID=A0AAE1CUE8_9GAST|nr:hypothetical protein RRG08_059246 [Elysia crispata]
MALNPSQENSICSNQEAIALVKSGATAATARKAFGIPYNTLRDNESATIRIIGHNDTPTASVSQDVAWMKEVFKMTNRIGLDKSLHYADVLETGEDNQEEEFLMFKNLILSRTTATQQLLSAGPTATHNECGLSIHANRPFMDTCDDQSIPADPTLDDNGQPITITAGPSATSNEDNQLLTRSQSIACTHIYQLRGNKTKTATNKKHTSLSMAFGSQEYRDYLQKKADDAKKVKEDKRKRKLEREELKSKRLREKEEKQVKRKLEREKKKEEKEELAKRKKIGKLLREDAKKKMRMTKLEESSDDEEVLESDEEMPQEQNPNK